MENNFNELYEKLFRLQWLLQRSHMQNHADRGPFANPTRGQGRVLAMLKIQPEISTKDLSYLLGIRQQSLNELLNKLEKGGYVTRIPSESDRRVMLVQLTEKGKREQQDEAKVPDIFDCLSPEEQETLASYLDRIIAALEARLGVDEGKEREQWMDGARARMGDEMFDYLMSMRGSGHPHGHGPHGRGFFGDFGGFGAGHGGCGPENHPFREHSDASKEPPFSSEDPKDPKDA